MGLSSTNWYIIIGGVVGALILIGCLIYYHRYKKSQESLIRFVKREEQPAPKETRETTNTSKNPDSGWIRVPKQVKYGNQMTPVMTPAFPPQMIQPVYQQPPVMYTQPAYQQQQPLYQQTGYPSYQPQYSYRNGSSARKGSYSRQPSDPTYVDPSATTIAQKALLYAKQG